ncbi:MAG: hypothetical protein CMO76_09425 [Verrucomicrobiales bacterium]|nr:hypothetical protein [Verrucomicrobiales bacterium]
MMKKALFILSFGTGILSAQTSTFITDGDWLDPANWDTGAVVPDNQTAFINANAIVDRNTGTANNDNPSRIEIGSGPGASGSVTVTGGTLSGAHGGGNGVFVGANGGNGTLRVEEGATYRTQGENLQLAVGDFSGGIGFVSVAGVMQIYKFLNVNNGTFEMMPTGKCNLFNSNDSSSIGAEGTLSFVIDGSDVGSLERSNTNGLNLTIDAAATLKINLGGDFELNDSWTLMRYTSFSGQFKEGESFTNEQGYTFAVDYGSGNNDAVTLTLTSDSERPKISNLTATPAAISAGASSTLRWSASNFDSLTLDPGEVDLTLLTETTIFPTETTTYTLTTVKGAASVSSEVTVVVDELPEINSFTASELLIAPGESTTLAWDVSGADSVKIFPPFSFFDDEIPTTGSDSAFPFSNTTFTLTATNATGSVNASLEVVVDALEAAIIHLWDPSLPRQTSGAILDSVGGKNFDITGGDLITDLTSDSNNLKAAINRVNLAANTGGDMGLGFPTQDTTFEIWVMPGELNDDYQVIFETGGPSDGTAILMNSFMVRFLHSTGGVNTLDLEVPFTLINPSDFVQILLTLDSDPPAVNVQAVNAYVKGSAGGAISASATALIGVPNGRASLFTWSGFGGGADGALGGTGGTAPLGVTSFKGSVGLFKIYDRALTEAEADEAYLKVADRITESDSDFDGLPDFWETRFFGDLAQGSSDNNDNDGLTNLEELNAGSNPTLADSDADGLDDEVEISLAEPTDVNNPDTDGDGLTDGEEVNGNPSSNPLIVDSDFDGFDDFFEMWIGSDPNDFNSLPPADEVGIPFANLNTLGTGSSFDALFSVADTLDVSFKMLVDFEEKIDGDREVVFETGGATVGISLTYEAGNNLVYRASGSGGLELAVAAHTLTERQLAGGEISVVVTYDVADENGDSVIAIYLDGALVASDFKPLGGDWTGTNGSAFGVASGNFAGDGANGWLTGVNFVSGSINERKGLTVYSDTLFTGGPEAALVITDLILDQEAGTIMLTFDSKPGRTYAVQRSFDLVTFDTIETGVASLGDETNSPAIAAPEGRSFYRVIEE